MTDVLFEISDDDICTAVPKSPAGCVVGNCIRRKLGNPHVEVQYSGIKIRGYSEIIPLAAGLRELMRNVDAGNKHLCQPMSFTLRIPSRLLPPPLPKKS